MMESVSKASSSSQESSLRDRLNTSIVNTKSWRILFRRFVKGNSRNVRAFVLVKAKEDQVKNDTWYSTMRSGILDTGYSTQSSTPLGRDNSICNSNLEEERSVVESESYSDFSEGTASESQYRWGRSKL